MAGTPLPQAQGLEWKPPQGDPRPLVPAAWARSAAAVDEPPPLVEVQAAFPSWYTPVPPRKAPRGVEFAGIE